MSVGLDHDDPGIIRAGEMTVRGIPPDHRGTSFGMYGRSFVAHPVPGSASRPISATAQEARKIGTGQRTMAVPTRRHP